MGGVLVFKFLNIWFVKIKQTQLPLKLTSKQDHVTPEETLEFRGNRKRPGIQDGRREKQQLRRFKNHVCAAQTNISDPLTSKAPLIWRVDNKNVKSVCEISRCFSSQQLSRGSSGLGGWSQISSDGRFSSKRNSEEVRRFYFTVKTRNIQFVSDGHKNQHENMKNRLKFKGK